MHFIIFYTITLCIHGPPIYKRELKVFDHRVMDDVKYLTFLSAKLFPRDDVDRIFSMPSTFKNIEFVEYLTWWNVFEDMIYFDTGLFWNKLYNCIREKSSNTFSDTLRGCVKQNLSNNRRVPSYGKVLKEKIKSDGTSIIQSRLRRLQLEIRIISVAEAILLNMKTDFVWEKHQKAVFDFDSLLMEVQKLVCRRPKLLLEEDELYCSELNRKSKEHISEKQASSQTKSRTRIVKKTVKRTYHDRRMDNFRDAVFDITRTVAIVIAAIICFLTFWTLFNAIVTGREWRHVLYLQYRDIEAFLSVLVSIFTSTGTPWGNTAILLAMKKYPTSNIRLFKETSSRETVLLGYDKTAIPNRTQNLKHFGYKLILRNPSNVSDEALKFRPRLQDHADRFLLRDTILIRHCIRANSSALWTFHSNLMVITADHEKMQQGLKMDKTCIVFYCLSKGYIPLGEKPFPKVLKCRLGQLETDVREGYFILGGPKAKTTRRRGDLDGFNDPLCMGSNIGDSNRGATGSLGLFIDLPDRAKGFLTCCHVLFDCIGHQPFLYNEAFEEKSSYHHVLQPGNSAFCGRNDKKCGEVERAVFLPNTLPVSVDAALVKITQRKPTNGHFVIRSISQVNEIGYKQDAYPQYNDGRIQRYIDESQLELPILKSGSTTGLTRSFLRLDCAEVRVFNEGVILGMKEAQPVVMKGQYEIAPGSIYNPFFIPGDSGSAVFLKEPNGRLVCIGIAIGKTSYETTVVTPIGPVLDKLSLDDDSVTKF